MMKGLASEEEAPRAQHNPASSIRRCEAVKSVGATRTNMIPSASAVDDPSEVARKH